MQAALTEVERCLSAASPDNNKHWYWKFYLLKAELIEQRTGPVAALKLLETAPIPDESDFRYLRAQKKLQQAKARIHLSEPKTAEVLLREARTDAIAAGSSDIQFDVAIWRAANLALKGDWPAAEGATREADQIASQTKQKRQQGLVYGTWGYINLRRSRFEEAISYFNRQVPLIASDRPSVQAAAFNNLGWCSFKLGDAEKALTYYQQALPLYRSISEKQGCLGNIGSVYLNHRNWAEAKRYYLDAIALNPGDRKFNAMWYGNLVEIAIQSRDWNAAEDWNRKAKEANRDGPTDLYALFHDGRIAQGRGDMARAESLFQQVLTTKSEDPTPELEAQALLAKLYAATDRADKAEAGFKAALDLSQGRRSRLANTQYKISYLDSKIRLYQDYVDFLMSHGRQDRALEIAEASRAQVLNERLGVQRSLNSRSAQYRQLAAQSHAVLLSYWLAPERSYVWIITPKDISALPLPPVDQITDSVGRYRAFIDSVRDPLDSDEPSGKEVYDMVVRPVMARIPPGSRVVVIPDGPLYALNLETVPVSQPKPHFLIDDLVTSVAPSLNLLAATAGRARALGKGESLLLIGDPSNTDGHFPKLQFASDEIAKVERHFTGARIQEFRDGKAVPGVYTDSAVRNVRYVHFAAHSVSDKLNPLESAIILAGPGDAGRLTAANVLQTPLDADLVTLSACDTAGGRTFSGEGVVGFAWAFLRAGAHNVIGGLWEVSDDTTPQIMDRLYQGLESGEDLAEALRAAKLAVMHSSVQYRRPYYWGPFQQYSGVSGNQNAPSRSRLRLLNRAREQAVGRT